MCSLRRGSRKTAMTRRRRSMPPARGVAGSFWRTRAVPMDAWREIFSLVTRIVVRWPSRPPPPSSSSTVCMMLSRSMCLRRFSFVSFRMCDTTSGGVGGMACSSARAYEKKGTIDGGALPSTGATHHGEPQRLDLALQGHVLRLELEDARLVREDGLVAQAAAVDLARPARDVLRVLRRPPRRRPKGRARWNRWTGRTLERTRGRRSRAKPAGRSETETPRRSPRSTPGATGTAATPTPAVTRPASGAPACRPARRSRSRRRRATTASRRGARAPPGSGRSCSCS